MSGGSVCFSRVQDGKDGWERLEIGRRGSQSCRSAFRLDLMMKRTQRRRQRRVGMRGWSRLLWFGLWRVGGGWLHLGALFEAIKGVVLDLDPRNLINMY